tara:strand:+ start:6096 stop:6746 length:651 start_codon:yes stop_codon:yes gene_type:complete
MCDQDSNAGASSGADSGASSKSEKKRGRIISRLLSKLLRHHLPHSGLFYSQDGYVLVQDILGYQSFLDEGVALDEIINVVRQNGKQRYQLDGDESVLGGLRIRACQGHSFYIPPHLLYVRIGSEDVDEYPESCHGSYRVHEKSIMRGGLLKMERSMVHIGQGLDAMSGMRSDCDMVIWIDLRALVESGMPVYVSHNGVILCEGPIHSKYFSKVEYI